MSGRPGPLTETHSTATVLIPRAGAVLDVGCDYGNFARHLTTMGCSVVGLDINEEAAADAADWCDLVVVGDVETLDLVDALAGRRFDVVTCLDVLEHLRDPTTVLRRLAEVLRPGGRIVFSIPNVTHAAVRLQLLGGSFRYTQQGLLDRTHIRFFDRRELEAMVAGAGLRVTDRLYIRKGLTDTEIAVDLDEHGADERAAALADPDADVYQFLWAVAPAEGELQTLGAEVLWHELELARAEVLALRDKLSACTDPTAPFAPAGGDLDLDEARAEIADLTWKLSHAERALVNREHVASRREHEHRAEQDELRERCSRLEASLAVVQGELAEERRRLSYRLTDRTIGGLRRRPVVWRLASRLRRRLPR